MDKDDDSIKYKDHIDVIIGKGEKRWSLWGLQNSPEDGQLIVACREKEDAVQQLTAWLQENPEAAERYSVEDLELRYMASVVPVDALSEADGIPKIYIMSFAPTATIAYGKYAMNVFRGAYKRSVFRHVQDLPAWLPDCLQKNSVAVQTLPYHGWLSNLKLWEYLTQKTIPQSKTGALRNGKTK